MGAIDASDIDAATSYQREFAAFHSRWLDTGMMAALDQVGIDTGVPFPPAIPRARRFPSWRSTDTLPIPFRAPTAASSPVESQHLLPHPRGPEPEEQT